MDQRSWFFKNKIIKHLAIHNENEKDTKESNIQEELEHKYTCNNH